MTSRARLQTARADAARLAVLLGTEHSAMADFILALSAFDASRGWAELGHASLFAFLQRQLGLSTGAAYHRTAAARLARRHAAVADALRAGRLCLSSAAELAKVLTPENEATVLPRFFGLSAREAKEVVAELQPHPSPPQRAVVRATVPAMAPPVPSTAEVVRTSETPVAATPREQAGSLFDAPLSVASAASAEPVQVQVPVPVAAARSRPADETVPLTADLRRLHVTVSRDFLQKLKKVRSLRSHARPGATTEAILEEALDLLLAREEKRRTAVVTRPPPAAQATVEPLALEAPQPHQVEAAGPSHAPPPGSPRAHLPAEVRREVWARDQGRCQWPMDGGSICGSTHRLQLDHTLAAARGGPPTAANLRILCEAHNKEAARRTFGPRWMGRFGPTRRTG